ncbi:MAG: hypothetical protein LUO83_08770, partial [Methanothrix sp.]|nr:hypothetical protein [Methanothrix sp.]
RPVRPLAEKGLVTALPLLLYAGREEKLVAEPAGLDDCALGAAHIFHRMMMENRLRARPISLCF